MKKRTKPEERALAAERLRKWRAKHREVVNEKQREYLAEWRLRNPEKQELYAKRAKRKRAKAKREAKYTE